MKSTGTRCLAVIASLLLVLFGSSVVCGNSRSGGDTVEVDLGHGASGNGGSARLVKVVATGVGADPEQAMQDAFSGAIEQGLGVLVDAETIVKNDQLVRDEVLTYSRGFVERYEVMKRWEKGGLHYARIWALVKVDKIAERLRKKNIAVRSVPGELLYRQAQHDINSEKSAAEMLERALEGYGLDTLMKVEIVSGPEVVDQTETKAKLNVQVRLSSNVKAWSAFRRHIDPLLRRFASTSFSYAVEARKIGESSDLRQVDASGFTRKMHAEHQRGKPGDTFEGRAWVCLFSHTSSGKGGTTMDWEAFGLPQSFEVSLTEVMRRGYRLCVRLVDKEGKEVLAIRRGIGRSEHCKEQLRHVFAERSAYHSYWLGPMMFCPSTTIDSPDMFLNMYFGGASARAPSLFCLERELPEITVDVDLSLLREIAKCTASIEEIPSQNP